MADAVKWALLVAGFVIIIALILALPFAEFFNLGEFSTLLAEFVELVGKFLTGARGLINNFFTPFGRKVISGLMIWFLGKWLITVSVKVVVWIYHFIFK